MEPNRWEEIISQVSSQNTHEDITTVDKVVIAAALGLSVSSFYALITMTSPGAWRYFVAGGICAATSHSIPVPIDVVKVRK
jgi:ABC-type proline/glycine betaine transport system permease subunit